jgi:phosphate-selective porin OprO/OprP
VSVRSRASCRAAALAALVTLARPLPIRAQSATGLSAASSSGEASAPVAGWKDGFFVQSADGSNRLVLGAVVQADGKFSLDDPSPFIDTFSLRKARLAMTGQIARYFAFRLTPEFSNGSPTITDAYADLRFSPAFIVRAGKDKTPVGLELLLYGDAGRYFNERSLASLLVPNRDDGVQIRGDVARGTVSYVLGVFNGVPDGASTSADVDTNGGKDVAGRIQARPFRRSGAARSPLDDLGLHFGFSSGSEQGALPSFKTSAGQRFFSYAPDAMANGRRLRLAPAAFYNYKSIGVFGEYTRTHQDVARAGVTHTIVTDGWNASGAVILTGEKASNEGVRPARPFDPAEGSWGAIEIAARWAAVHVDDDAFTFNLVADDAVRDAHQVSVGVNWYPVDHVKYSLSYERTSFTGGATARPTEHAILFRTQIAF